MTDSKSSNQLAQRLQRAIKHSGSPLVLRDMCEEALAEIERLTRELELALDATPLTQELIRVRGQRDRLARENQELREKLNART
jgi:hypothetical protein